MFRVCYLFNHVHFTSSYQIAYMQHLCLSFAAECANYQVLLSTHQLHSKIRVTVYFAFWPFFRNLLHSILISKYLYLKKIYLYLPLYWVLVLIRKGLWKYLYLSQVPLFMIGFLYTHLRNCELCSGYHGNIQVWFTFNI